MDQSTLLVVAICACLIYWYVRNQRRPAVLVEVCVALRNLADARHESIGNEYREMADAIMTGMAYASSKKPIPEETRKLVSYRILSATSPDLLEKAGFHLNTGRQAAARDALGNLWHKLNPKR